MNVKLVVVAVLWLAVGVAAALGLMLAERAGLEVGRGEAGVSGSLPNTGRALVGGPFSLIDHTGRRVTDRDFHGRHMLVFFGFTYCPDVCPGALSRLAAALDALGPEGAKVTPVFVTVDPERDTPEKMAAYVASFHPRLVGLTGTRAEVDAAIRAYHVYAKKVPTGDRADGYTMDHSDLVYVMRPDGAFAGHVPTAPGEPARGTYRPLTADELALQIRRALALTG